MNGIVAKVYGIKDLNTSTKNISKHAREAVISGLNEIGLVTVSECRRIVSKTSPGSVRKQRYAPRRQAIVSPPGAAPNTDQGGLASSILHGVNKMKLSVQVGTNLDYGRFLELGTTDMAPRPWLMPSIRKMKRFFPRIMKEHIKKAVGKK